MVFVDKDLVECECFHQIFCRFNQIQDNDKAYIMISGYMP
jgi:hypothetical protein